MNHHPGSDGARALGCICAIMDNNHGLYPPFPANDEHDGLWYITGGCPVHDSVGRLKAMEN